MKTLTADAGTDQNPAATPVSPDAFKSLFRSHPGPVAVITAAGNPHPIGFTATSVISLSAEPPLLAFSVSATSSSLAAMRVTQNVAVHLLDTDHEALAQRFATSGVDRFAALDWAALPDGTPLIQDVRSWAWGPVAHRFEVDGSLLTIVRIDESSTSDLRAPLLYKNRRYCHLDDA